MDYVAHALPGAYRLFVAPPPAAAPQFADLINHNYRYRGIGYALKNSVVIGTRKEFFGVGQIRGDTKDKNGTLMPGRRVRLYDFQSGLMIGECFSDENAIYQFDRLDPSRIYVLNAHDHKRDWEGVIADYTSAKEIAYP